MVVSEATDLSCSKLFLATLPDTEMDAVAWQVPVYIGLKDQDGRQFEDKGNCH